MMAGIGELTTKGGSTVADGILFVRHGQPGDGQFGFGYWVIFELDGIDQTFFTSEGDIENWTNDGELTFTPNDAVWSEAVGRWVIVGDGGDLGTIDDISVEAAETSRTPDASYTGDFARVIAVSGVGFVAVGTGGEIQVSADGITWSQEKTGGDDIIDVATSDDGSVIVAITATDRFRSTDGGDTWSSGSAHGASAALAIAFHKSHGFVIYGGSDGTFVSADGNSFTQVETSAVVHGTQTVELVAVGGGFVLISRATGAVYFSADPSTVGTWLVNVPAGTLQTLDRNRVSVTIDRTKMLQISKSSDTSSPRMAVSGTGPYV